MVIYKNLRDHIKAMKDAVELDGVDLLGYTTWGPIAHRLYVSDISHRNIQTLNIGMILHRGV